MNHGGVPSDATVVDDLALAKEKHPSKSHLEEMLWSDPTESLGLELSLRGAGKLFGEDVTKRFLDLVGAKVLIRGHQECPEGYKIDHGGKILTLFSTNNVPYNNEKAEFLPLDLTEKVTDSHQLEKNIVILSDKLQRRVRLC
jgi:serine/threonine-protein phosphatase 5